MTGTRATIDSGYWDIQCKRRGNSASTTSSCGCRKASQERFSTDNSIPSPDRQGPTPWSSLFGPFHKGRGGPGGWWIIIEPEVHFIRDTEVLVPDVAGWRRKRMPDIPRDHRFQVAPDWICEILSPSTASKDREVKLPIYAHYGVQYTWLVDPLAHTLEALGLQDGSWVQLGSFRDDDRVSIAPFAEISIALPDLWC